MNKIHQSNNMYTCPMHPEVRSEMPGRCPKCGMQLVPEGKLHTAIAHDDRGLGPLTWRSYLPLVVIIALILVSAAVPAMKDYQARSFSIYSFVTYFMTGFFLVFAGFKLIDLKGFAEGYSTYDLLAQKVFAYSYIYPFIELGFGLAMLAGAQIPALLWAEVAVMGFSGIGVLLKLLRREPVQCVCLGTILKVPLTKITLIEDFGMALLALILLVR